MISILFWGLPGISSAASTAAWASADIEAWVKVAMFVAGVGGGAFALVKYVSSQNEATKRRDMETRREFFDDHGETCRLEPPRECWRLQSLRGWSDDTTRASTRRSGRRSPRSPRSAG